MLKGKQSRLKRTLRSRKVLFLIALFLLLGVASSTLWWTRYRKSSTSSTPGSLPTVPTPEEAVNLDPPTAIDKQESDQNKEKLGDQQSQPSTTPKGTATVVITYAGQYGQNIEVAAYASNVYEDGGTCTATFTNGSYKITRDTKGFKDVRTTMCPPFSIPRGEFPVAGSWTVVVTYTSQTAHGTSDKRVVEVR